MRRLQQAWMYLVWAGRCNGNASVFGPTRTAVVWAGALGTGFDSRSWEDEQTWISSVRLFDPFSSPPSQQRGA